ncbi:MAG: disulfide bond formation protein DsbA, partial [Alcanivorax sp.]|nr:disulfide bond formation protein DsbA [Alcanivorax sp.]
MLRQVAGAFALLGLIFALPALADSGHARFAEGTHYQVLSEPVSVADPDKIEVREFFF